MKKVELRLKKVQYPGSTSLSNTSEIEIGKVYQYSRWYERGRVVWGKKVPDTLCRCCNRIFNLGGSSKWSLCEDCLFKFHFWYLREKGHFHGEKGPNGATFTKFTKTNIELFLLMMKR
ncbi:MAG: hypothetical protein IMZ52_01930 [Actinobacteria bacterium]|nr:hypothetical protein [Actinomycetota bacterium]MBE3122661.1 hypothetical protein [Thermoplasmata archaeon]